ncbi:MAG: tetratricopeptide repeat protein [Melioribacteraceae bacterium]|nr:tetratricopeptide repeat protein [Melioribacteraceae bacterium]
MKATSNLLINFLKEALNYSSQDAEIFFHLSRSYFAMDNIDQAIESLRNCLNISPEYPEANKIYEHL